MELRALLCFTFLGLLCAADAVFGVAHKGRQHKLYGHDDEEPQNVELEPEMKTAASLSHAMLQQLTDAVRSLLPLREQVTQQQTKIDEIYKMSVDSKQYLVSSKQNETEVKEMRAELESMSRKSSSGDIECSESLEHCRQNTRNALTELRFRCDRERNATEKKWLDKVQELSLQKGGQMSEMQQGCETQTIQLQTQCFTKMMQISAEADKTTEALKAHNERLQAQVDELTSKLGRCAPERMDFEYQGNIAKSAKGMDLDKAKQPAPSDNPDCEGYAEPSSPIPPNNSENGMNVGNNKQYIIGTQKVTWDEANQICRAKGMWLLTQEHEKDKHLLNLHIQKIVGPQAATFWMSARKEEGETWFMWQCYASNQRPWRHTQNPKMDKRCAFVTYQRAGKGVWSDDPCDATHRYICQKTVN